MVDTEEIDSASCWLGYFFLEGTDILCHMPGFFANCVIPMNLWDMNMLRTTKFYDGFTMRMPRF